MKKEMSFKDRMRKVRLAANTALITGSIALNQFLINAGKDYDFLKQSGNNTFKSINSTAQKTGASFFSLMKTFGVIAIMAMLVLCGISFVSSKNANKREETKSHFLWIVVGAAIIFGVTGFIALFSNIGSNIK